MLFISKNIKCTFLQVAVRITLLKDVNLYMYESANSQISISVSKIWHHSGFKFTFFTIISHIVDQIMNWLIIE